MEDRRPRKEEGGRLGGGEGWRVGVKVKRSEMGGDRDKECKQGVATSPIPTWS